MSSIASYTSSSSDARPVAWGRFTVVGLATIAAALLANTLVYFLGGAVVNYDADFVVLSTIGGTIFFTTIAAIVAVLLYAALLRSTANPARIFTIVSAVVLVVSVVPDFAYPFSGRLVERSDRDSHPDAHRRRSGNRPDANEAFPSRSALGPQNPAGRTQRLCLTIAES